jgi:molybdate-binding protein
VPASPSARVVLASIAGRWVAHRLATSDSGAFLTAADAVVLGPRAGTKGSVRVALLEDASAARDTLLCAGCAPALGILAARATAARPGERVVWLERSSGAALDLLARGQVHVAGAHLFDEQAQEFNVPFVQRLLPGRSMLIFNLARWETGLVVAAGNPRRVRGVSDLARPDVRFVRRQASAAGQDLIERLLRRAGLPVSAVTSGPLSANGHMEVARIVALGLADVGVALPEVARAYGLDFVPLAQERFDLILAKEHAGDTRIVRLLETLSGRGFRREMETLGGHVARDAGKLIADTGAAP